MREDQFKSKLNWQNICLYCTKDLNQDRGLIKYCSDECKKQCWGLNMKELDEQFKWVDRLYDRVEMPLEEDSREDFMGEEL